MELKKEIKTIVFPIETYFMGNSTNSLYREYDKDNILYSWDDIYDTLKVENREQTIVGINEAPLRLWASANMINSHTKSYESYRRFIFIGTVEDTLIKNSNDKTYEEVSETLWFHQTSDFMTWHIKYLRYNK